MLARRNVRAEYTVTPVSRGGQDRERQCIRS